MTAFFGVWHSCDKKACTKYAVESISESILGFSEARAGQVLQKDVRMYFNKISLYAWSIVPSMYESKGKKRPEDLLWSIKVCRKT